LLPAVTEVGAAELVTIRSDCAALATTSEAVALLLALLGSVVAELIVAVSMIVVPAEVPAVTFTITGKLAVPGAKLVFVQVIVPVPPTAGTVHDQPDGTGLSDTKVVFAGIVSVKLADVAAPGPAFVTTCV